MSLKSALIHLHILSDTKAAADAVGVKLLPVVTAGLASAVSLAAHADNPIGQAALAAAQAAEATGKSGAEKRADVIAAVAPVIVSEAAKGGTTALVHDAEAFAGLVLEEVLQSIKTTPLGLIGTALLRALGVA